MSGGLVALMEHVAVIAKVAAASVDDVSAAASRAGAKAVAVVIDDTAVTPQYVQGFQAERELPIIWRIARGSLRNKLIILPAALLLSQVLPQALTPLLMLGGVYLSFEGAEKVYEALGGPAVSSAQPQEGDAAPGTPAYEKRMVSEAVRTDFILSTEIMVIALAEVAAQPLLVRTLSLVAVALLITALVYGVVGVLVKLDDLGLGLARRGHLHISRALGRGLVRVMPLVLDLLTVVGTAAMLWVGGHMVLAGLAQFGLAAPLHLAETLSERAAEVVPPALAAAAAWLTESATSALFGLLLGFLLMAVIHTVRRWRRRRAGRGSR